MELKKLLSLTILIFLGISICVAQNFKLQILHHNDGESELLPGSDGYGGAAQFKGVIDSLRYEGYLEGYPTLLFSAGDNFLAGKEFDASLNLNDNQPYFDGLAMSEFVYDAIAIGNHEFDFGPEILARFINSFDQSRSGPLFMSANLDFSGEPNLAALEEAGRIVKRAKIWRGSEPIGVIGLTTPNLPFVSSPRNVAVDPNLIGITQAEIDAFEAEGVNKIILISHLQGRAEEQELVSQLRGVDIVIAGGGGELLANDPSKVIPGDEENIDGPYPISFADAGGNTVYLVTTSGDYRYLGNLIVDFDEAGQVVGIDEESGPVPVKGKAKEDILKLIELPIQNHVDALNQQIVGTTEVALNGIRNVVRGEESNEGNLIADALLWFANEKGAAFNAPKANVALVNGGGIRNNNIIEAGSTITASSTFDMLPFGNKVTVVGPISPQTFKLIMENAVSRITAEGPSGSGTGRFAQIAGFTLEYALDGMPLTFDETGEQISIPGNRIVTITLNEGNVPIVAQGQMVAGAPEVYIATADFLARGGDQYPFGDTPFTILGNTGQQALLNYIQEGLNGIISAEEYPEGGEGRIQQVDLPIIGPRFEFETVKEAIFRTNLLQILEQAVKHTDLEQVLEGEGPFTVFAPINNAFARLNPEDLNTLFGDNPELLRTTLLQHVIREEILSSQLTDGQTINTIDGTNIVVKMNEDGIFLNHAKVVQADLRTENGVIHLIMDIIR